jgi:hypothetical protein
MRDTPSDRSNEQRDPSGQMYVTAGNIPPLGLLVVIFYYASERSLATDSAIILFGSQQVFVKPILLIMKRQICLEELLFGETVSMRDGAADRCIAISGSAILR